MDYEKIGFKSGLEIHQQLNTNKLFCNCPSLLRSDNPHFEIKRKLHAIAGESGEVDEAVRHEADIGKEFFYQGYNDTTCLVEIDEAPPEEINLDALKIGLQIALLLNCEIIPVTQIMRKTVIDGSNTGGFQRTLLIAKNGFIETSFGRVGIDTVAIEEDACRIVERSDKKVVYRLDRLGIPLVEIATSPDMKNPLQVKEAALHLGEILRACNVKRGIGTIRQDVNVSISGHPRVEIKGFQEPKMFEITIDKEIERQLDDIKKKSGVSEVRKANDDGSTEFMRPMPGASRMYPETDLTLLKISRDLINEVKKNLPKMKKEIKSELKSLGLSEEMINLVLSNNKLEEFKELIGIYHDSELIAKMLVLWPKDFAKKLNKSQKEIEKILNPDTLESVIDALKSKKIKIHDVQEILYDLASGSSVKEVIERERVDSNIVEEFIVNIVKKNPGLRENAYIGMVMKEFKGKISGKEISEILKKYIV
jgi:Glu-tRNA(Gln) amidotransferase subunit E-like FAD-binding protein